MSRYDLYTASIGVLSVFFSMAVFEGDLSVAAKIFLMIVGAAIFAHSAYTLYTRANVENRQPKKFTRQAPESNAISKISLLDKKGEVVTSWELYGKTSAVIGKDVGENSVDIDLSQNPYAALVDVEHAVLNYADGNWYIEDLDSRNGIAIKKFGQEKIFKLSSLQPCKLDFGDVIFIGVCQLKLN